MKTSKLANIFMICAFVAISCTKSNTLAESCFTVNGTIISTKVPSTDATGAGSFSKGDKISLFFEAAGTPVCTGYTFGEKNYWNDLSIPEGTGTVSATGCYPAVKTDTPHSFNFDCSAENAETDFLAGEKVPVSPFLTQTIDMSFKHILHKLSVSLEAAGDGISADDLKDAVISCTGVLPTASLNLLEATVGNASGTPHEFRKTGDRTHFIIPPQATEGIKIKISVGGREYAMSGQDFSVNGQKVTYLHSGQTLSVKIKVSKSSFTVTGQTIGSWTSQGEINGEIEILASISGLSSAGSKVITGQDGSGNFEEGDIISLHIKPSDKPGDSVLSQIKFEGNKWETGPGWSEIGSSEASLTAFYPAHNESSDRFTHIVSSDQQTGTEYLKSDLLGASAKAKRGEAARLDFSHLMSRVNVRLTCDGSFSAEEMAEATVQMRSKNAVSIISDFSSPTGIRIGEVSGNEVFITAKNTGNGSFSAIVCPQDILESWRASGWIRITVGNRTLEYKAPEKLQSGETFSSLESGKETNISINLKKKEESWAGKTFWTYGLQNPSLEQWGYAYVTPQKILGLKWNSSYGWYDCNKTEPNRPGKDSEMCWAATAANMIYWWLDRNRENIEKYGKYNGPSKYADSFDCEIFEFYKSHFFNEGNDLSAALSWFFTGRFGTGTKPGAGFFNDVLGNGAVAEITRFGDMSFSDAMKKAFRSNEATGCVIEFPNRYLHAISVWGADFDQEGKISAIYISDSNDRDLEDQWEGSIPGLDRPQTKAGLIRKGVQKKADGHYYMESSSPGHYTFKIIELYFLGIKQAEWDQYFR